MNKKTIALDFDGVLHVYDRGWQDGSIYGDVIEGAVEAVQALSKEYSLVIFTCRVPVTAVFNWVKEKFNLEIPVTNAKPHADMYIDDRGHHFQAWENTLYEIGYRAKSEFKVKDRLVAEAAGTYDDGKWERP